MRNKRLIAGLIISFAAIAVVFALTFDPSSIKKIGEIKVVWLIFGAFLHILSWVVWGLRITVMCRYIDKDKGVSLKEGIGIAISNLFLSAVTPSSIGGEPVRIHLLSKKGFGVGKSTALVVGERIFDAIFFTLSLPVAVFILNTYIKNEVMKLILLAGTVLFMGGLILFAYLLEKPEIIKKLAKSLMRKIKIKKIEKKIEEIIDKIDDFVESFHKGAKEIFSWKNISAIGVILAITSIYWLLEFLVPSCILKGLGQDPVIIQSVSAQILLVIMSIIPITPGGSGIAEGGAAVLYSFFVPDKSILGIFILGWRLVTYYLNIVVGGVYQHKIFGSFDK